MSWWLELPKEGLPEGWVRALGVSRMWDALSEAEVTPHGGQVVLPPYARVWLL